MLVQDGGLQRTLDYLALSLPTLKQLHQASVPELDVPQVCPG